VFIALLSNNFGRFGENLGSVSGLLPARLGRPHELGSQLRDSTTTVSGSRLAVWKITITITMCHESHCGWFEATIETLAVGIYLYATFVLTGSLFLSRELAIIDATVMVLSLGAIRASEAVRQISSYGMVEIELID